MARIYPELFALVFSGCSKRGGSTIAGGERSGRAPSSAPAARLWESFSPQASGSEGPDPKDLPLCVGTFGGCFGAASPGKVRPTHRQTAPQTQPNSSGSIAVQAHPQAPALPPNYSQYNNNKKTLLKLIKRLAKQSLFRAS